MSFDQHMLVCNYRTHTKTLTEQYTTKERNESINIQELLAIITKQDQQIQKMSKQLSQINQILNRQERRNICEHLNRTDTDFSTFGAWINDLEISFPFILSMCQTDIRDALMERFRQYYLVKSQSHSIPMKAFIENKSKMYIYDIDTQQPGQPLETEAKWMVLTNEHLSKIVGEIYRKWKKTFAKWMIENEDEFDVNHDMNEMKQAYMNKMDRYNHLSEKEKNIKIKNWIVQKIETNMPQIVIIDA